jgi:hypothetical protein
MVSDTALKLAELKRWRRIRNWSIWASVPGVLLVSNVLFLLTRLDYSFLIVVAGWMFWIEYAGRRVRLWPCPNCGKEVMRNRKFYNDFSSKCLHCGFSLKA